MRDNRDDNDRDHGDDDTAVGRERGSAIDGPRGGGSNDGSLRSWVARRWLDARAADPTAGGGSTRGR